MVVAAPPPPIEIKPKRKRTSTKVPTKLSTCPKTTNVAADIAQFWKNFNHRPYFYEESELLNKIFDIADINLDHLSIDVENLYTLHQSVTIPPFGRSPMEWRRLGASGFLLRPYFSNTKSCLNISEKSYAYLGNLGYLTNPAWACYIMYSKDSPGKLGFDSVGFSMYTSTERAKQELNPELLGELPNVLSAVNICLGYLSETGEPAALIAKINGQFPAFSDMVGLFRHFRSNGYRVVSSLLDRRYVEDISTKGSFQTPPIVPLISIDNSSIPNRGTDVTMALGSDINNVLHITEKHCAGRVVPDKQLYLPCETVPDVGVGCKLDLSNFKNSCAVNNVLHSTNSRLNQSKK